MSYFKDIYYMFSYIYVLLFIYLFIPHRFPKKKTVLICLTTFVFLTLPNYLKLQFFPDSNLCYFLVTVFQIVLTQSTALHVSRTRDSRALFLGLTASNYVIAGSVTAGILHIYTDNIPLSLLGCLTVHTGILVFLHFKIRNTCLSFFARRSIKNWWELCLIPVFFYCGFSCLAFFPYTFDDNPKSIPGAVFFLITMFVSYVIVLRYLENALNTTDMYWKNALFEEQIKNLESQHLLAEQSAQSLKILRHDMRHYAGMIDTLLAQGEYDKIRELTRHLNETADEHRLTAYCKNIVVNSVLSEQMEKARALGVELALDILMPGQLPVNEYELASAIANLLENALECAAQLSKEKRHVSAKLHCDADHLFIETSNAYGEEIEFDPVTSLPVSSRGNGHGLGLLSVSAFTKKIGGSIGCYCEDHTFRILLFAKFQV